MAPAVHLLVPALALLALVGAPSPPLIAHAVKGSGGDSQYFPGSKILDKEMGVSLNGLTELSPTQNWKMCYSSITNDSSTPDMLHQLCGQHKQTLSVVINQAYTKNPNVFGAWAVRSPQGLLLLASSLSPTQSLSLRSQNADDLLRFPRRRARGTMTPAAL